VNRADTSVGAPSRTGTDVDVIVVGLGAMGSAVAAHCAARGLRVLAVERHAPGHAQGSSHGYSRIIRLAYFEHPSYVPLLRRAFALWRDLEQGLPSPLLHVTGALDVGWAGSTVVEGSLRSCREHALSHELLDAAALARRFPGWHPSDEAMAVFQPDGGFLEPERCIAAHVARAMACGATVHAGETVRRWTAHGGTVIVETDRGRYEAGQLVLAGGAWMGDLVPTLAPLLAPERQVVGWFEIAAAHRAAFAPSAFPVFVLEDRAGLWYGFPEHTAHGAPAGCKVGKYHHHGERVHPDTMDRRGRPEDEATLRDAVARWFPAANGAMRHASTCLFTNTPDGHFIIDRAPGMPEVLCLSPCSGHGFKFAAVIGEIAADLVADGTTAHDISLFRLDRFSRFADQGGQGVGVVDR
jgi:sarcosine oxidase